MNTISAFLLRPFQFEGTKLHPNILLMCKLFILLITAHHIFYKIEDPFIPFIPALDGFNAYPNVFAYSLRSLYVLSAFALMFNIRVRTASILLGLIVIINILASKPLFFNHTFICGCALFLAGLTNNEQPPYLLIYQMSIVYLGASINKFLEPDWWSGAFMDNWLGNARTNITYLSIAKLLPDMVFAKFLSYIAMFTEFAIAIMILFKRTRNLTVWFIIVFHTLLFTMTSTRFGHFIESLAIVLLAFLNVPKQQLIIHYKSSSVVFLKTIFSFLDRDKKQQWIPIKTNSSNWLEVKIRDKKLTNHNALKDIMLYTPNFFIALVILDMGSYVILYNHRTALFIINIIIVWTVIFYFLFFNLKNSKSHSFDSHNKESQNTVTG